MDVFNKLKSAVSNVLPGNPLSRDFEIYNQVSSVGPGLLWKVYAAVKRSTKEEASVFLFEKKVVERYAKRDREVITTLLRSGVQQLTKLRHPKILAVIHPLEESREALAFATEPVFASLANVLGEMTHVTPVPKELQEFQLYDVEIKHGILQVAEGIGFLHSGAKMMHRNLCPQSVVLTKQGCWKLAGCEFCVQSTDPQSQDPPFPFFEWRTDMAPITQINLDYMAPEYVLTMCCGTASDMFSLGLLIYAMYAKGKPLFECSGELSTFKKNAEELRHMRASQLGPVPDDLREHVKLLLNTEPTVRPDAAQFTKVPFFEDMGCVTLQYIDTLFQRENIEKSNFFKGLPKVIAKLPKRVSLQRILPALFKEAVNPDMVPFLLPSILLVAEQSSDTEYKQLILPHLVPLFKLQEPVQVVLIFMQNMSLLLSKTPTSDIQAQVLPMIFRALEADSPQIQELCLSITPTFADLIEYPTLKNSLVPRIKKLCLGTSVLTVRVNCLLCIGQLMDHMDKWYVLDEILPFLHKIPTREPAVLMSILGIHKVAFEGSKLGITKDTLASKVLPFLIPIATDSNLNLAQFNAFMTVIRDMLGKMESEHRTKLEQLDQMKQEQRSLEITRITGQDGELGAGDLNSNAGKNPTMMDKFLSGFGLAGLMSSPAQRGGSPGSQSPVSSPSGAGSGAATPTSTPSSSAASVIPLPKKTNLTLEEKQRLAQQQEQQQRLKSQASLTPGQTSTGKTITAATPKSGTKDLTSTLMESNMNAMKSMGMGQTSNAQSSFSSGGTWNSGPTWSSGNSSMGMGGGGSGMGMGGGFTGSGFGSGGMSPMGGASPARMGVSNQQQPKVDMSAFDSLMQKPQKPSMIQMTNTSGGVRPMGSNMSPMGANMGINPAPMGMMGMNAGGMGPMGMRPQFMGGPPQQPLGFPQGGGMYGQPMGMASPAQNAGFGGQMLSPTSTSSAKPSANSLDDLFG